MGLAGGAVEDLVHTGDRCSEGHGERGLCVPGIHLVEDDGTQITDHVGLPVDARKLTLLEDGLELRSRRRPGRSTRVHREICERGADADNDLAVKGVIGVDGREAIGVL